MVRKTNELARRTGGFYKRAKFKRRGQCQATTRMATREIVNDFAGERLDSWVTGFGAGGRSVRCWFANSYKERPEVKIILSQNRARRAHVVTSDRHRSGNPDGSRSRGTGR